jgi:hypothetical protein
MPKAARVRVASPPAGTALARAIRDCRPEPRPSGARFDPACNIVGDACQWISDDLFNSVF